MPRRSPPNIDYSAKGYEAASAHDYSYDPQLRGPSFDPHSDIHSGYIHERISGPPGSRAYHRNYVHEDSNHDTRSPDDKTTHDSVIPHSPRVPPSPLPPSLPISTFPAPIPTSPTPEYLSTSLTPSTTLPDPSTSRKLLILDLNGTLLLRGAHKGRSPYNNRTARRPLRPVYPRPYIASFREYLFHKETHAWLDTMVWSSAQPHSVADMVDKCFAERQDELVAVWARDTLGLDDRAYNTKTQTTKDLAKPWAALASSTITNSLPNSPSHGSPAPPKSPPYPKPAIETTETTPTASPQQAHSARTTLLLDDSPLKAHLQPWNHVCIREYVTHMRQWDLEVHGEERTHESSKGKKRKRQKREGKSKEEHDVDRRDAGFEEVRVGTEEGSLIPSQVPTGEPVAPDARPQLGDDAHDPRGGKYDETLLAVIGILDAIKGESNVAGWIRSGGLLGGNGGGRVRMEEMAKPISMLGNGKPTGDSDDRYDSDLSVDRDVREGGPRKRKRRRVDVGDGDDGGPSLAVSSASPIHTVRQPETWLEGEIGAGTEARGEEQGEEDGTEMWFENEATIDGWVGRGRRALEELGIPVVSGVGA